LNLSNNRERGAGRRARWRRLPPLDHIGCAKGAGAAAEFFAAQSLDSVDLEIVSK